MAIVCNSTKINNRRVGTATQRKNQGLNVYLGSAHPKKFSIIMVVQDMRENRLSQWQSSVTDLSCIEMETPQYFRAKGLTSG
jgi:hypothetical protein